MHDVICVNLYRSKSWLNPQRKVNSVPYPLLQSLCILAMHLKSQRSLFQQWSFFCSHVEWTSYAVGIKERRAFPLENSSPCSSNKQVVYLLPHLSKSFSCFYEFKIPVHDLSLPAQISETTVKAENRHVVLASLCIFGTEGRTL